MLYLLYTEWSNALILFIVTTPVLFTLLCLNIEQILLEQDRGDTSTWLVPGGG